MFSMAWLVSWLQRILTFQIVKTGDGEIGSAGGTGSAAGEGSTIGATRGGALSKLKQSVASGIQGFSQPAKTPPTTPTKLFNRELTGHLTEEERCILEKVFEKEQQFEMMQKWVNLCSCGLHKLYP